MILNDIEQLHVRHARELAARLEQKHDNGATTTLEQYAVFVLPELLNIIDRECKWKPQTD